MVDSALSTARIEELIQEDQNVKHRRERIQRQSSLLSKLTRQLSIHDNRAAAASSWSNGGGGAGKYNCICCRLPFLLCFGYLNWTDNNACRIKNFPCLWSNDAKFLFHFVTILFPLVTHLNVVSWTLTCRMNLKLLVHSIIELNLLERFLQVVHTSCWIISLFVYRQCCWINTVILRKWIYLKTDGSYRWWFWTWNCVLQLYGVWAKRVKMLNLMWS